MRILNEALQKSFADYAAAEKKLGDMFAADPTTTAQEKELFERVGHAQGRRRCRRSKPNGAVRAGEQARRQRRCS